jgi:hypothetical protein
MKVGIEGFQVKFDAPIADEREFHRNPKKPGVHCPGGLPTDRHPALGKKTADSYRVRHLTGRISTEETDAVCALVGAISQFLCAQGLNVPLSIHGRIGISKVPILAKQAIQGATGVEDRQVMLTMA